MSEVAVEGEDDSFVEEEDAGASISDVEAEIEKVVGGAVKEEDFDDSATIGGVRLAHSLCPLLPLAPCPKHATCFLVFHTSTTRFSR